MIRSWFLLLAVFLACGLLRADEIILNDGRVIQGRIVEETPRQVRIRTGPQMNLAFEKSQIRSLTRSGNHKADASAEKTAQKVEASTAPAPVPDTPVKRLPPGADESSASKNGVSIAQTVIVATYPVSSIPKDVIPAAERTFDFSWSGKVQKDNGSVKWTDLSIEPRMFFRVPDWISPPKPAEADVVRWNQFVRDLERHNAGHLRIFKGAVDSLSQGLASLRAEDEAKLRAQSASLAATVRRRVQKRQRGFDRHAVEERENPIAKKKK